jgi:DNA-binding response OmpR family regulator
MSKLALVVEDSETQAWHLKTLLENAGMAVDLAYNGIDGLELAQMNHPEVIVLDVQLPDMNGFQVCQQLKESQETAEIPVVMLTRQETHEAVVAGLQAGAIEFIPKDAFADAVLIETLKQMGLLE